MHLSRCPTKSSAPASLSHGSLALTPQELRDLAALVADRVRFQFEVSQALYPLTRLDNAPTLHYTCA
jgi:hypothetical protein